MIELLPANSDDFMELCGRTPPCTVRAIKAVKDGVIGAIAGVTLKKGEFIAFSEMRDLDVPKMTRWKVALAMADWMRSLQLPIMVVTPNTNSGKFLTSVGFEFCKEHNDSKIFRLSA